MRYPSTLALLFTTITMTMPLFSRSITSTTININNKRWLHRYALQSNNNNVAFQSTRSRCSKRIIVYPRIADASFHHNRYPVFESATTRLFSTTENKSTQHVVSAYDEEELDPYDILRELQNNNNDNEPLNDEEDQLLPIRIPMPTHLSPTSLETFKKCPQSFFFLYILKLTQDPPMTEPLARGIICHAALENVFDLKPADRTLQNLENLFRREWGKLRGDREGENAQQQIISSGSTNDNKYDVLFREEDGTAYDIESEIEWGKSSLELLRSYYELEDPRTVTTPNPLVKEMWVQARLPTLSDSEDEEEFIELKGKIDRIDVLPNNPSSDDRLQLQIIDYKTGKKPNFKYSKSVNDRISNEQFWKMKVYALMLYKMIRQTDALSEQPNDQEGYKYAMPWTLQQRLKQALTNNVANTPDWGSVLELNSLRLMYLTSHLDDDSINDSNTATSGTVGKAACLDYPLMGSQSSEIIPFLNEMELEVQTIAKDIKILVDQQDPHAFKHCDWRYCSCHELRRRFRPGSVYQSPELDV